MAKVELNPGKGVVVGIKSSHIERTWYTLRDFVQYVDQ